jgi:hypothetical protein
MNHGMATCVRGARARAARDPGVVTAADPARDGVVDIGDLVVLAEHWLSWCGMELGGADNAVTEVPVR